MKEFVLTGPIGGPSKIDYAKELNPEQLEVILRGDGPCLVLAGAGSGKTRTITYRVASLIEKGVLAENILLVTFTNKAAKEMLSRVATLSGVTLNGLWGGTFHSVANRILRAYAAEVGHTSHFTILDQEDGRDMFKMCLKELGVDTTARRFPSPANLQAMVSYGRNASLAIREVIEQRHPNFSDLTSTIERIAELYEARKRRADAMDFDDLLILLRELLYKNAIIRDRLASQFQYILVDEYQDTNVVQADIIRQLASVHGNVLVVGDDAQSIYSFRAAEIRNILQFPETNEGTKVFCLTTNYRSTPEILTLANAAIRQNREQFKKELTSVRPGFEKPHVVPAASAAQEAQFIAERMLQLRDEGVPLSEIAVLFRAAFHSQALEFEMMKRDIPYEYRGGMKFFERAHVKDIVAHLRIASNPKDEMAWVRVLGLQSGVGLTTAGKIVDQVRQHDTIDAAVAANVSLGSRAQNGWAQFVITAKRMLAGNRLPSDMIRAVVAGGYNDYLEAEYPDFRERLEDLEQFALFAETYQELSKFLDDVSLTDEYGASRDHKSETNEPKAVLSTIHQAKGLEWDAVFVINLVDGKFPNQRALDEHRGLEEERRLFYVASTRARRHLFLTYPITSGYDTLVISQPSQFIQELPPGVFEHVKLRHRVVPRSPSAWEDNEPTIVLNEIGEDTTPRKPRSGGFLRDIGDL